MDTLEPAKTTVAESDDEAALFRDLVETANDIFVTVGGDGRVRFVNQTFCRLTGYSRDEVEGETLSSLFGEEQWRDAQERLTSALTSSGKSSVDLALRTKQGEPVEVAFRATSERTEEGALRRLILVGQSPYLYGVLAAQFNRLNRDLRGSTRRLARLNAELELRIEERTSRLTALLEVSASLNAELQLDALFELILRQATETIAGAQAGALLLHDADADRMLVKAACGYADGAIVQDLQAEMERTHPLSVVGDREVEVWSGVREEKTPRMKLLVRNVDQFRIRSAAVVPISTPSEPLGILLLHNFDDTSAFGPDDLALAKSMAGSAAIAIVNARLHEETRRQAERLELVNRLAASVGDSIDLEQTLGLAVLGLRLALGASRVAVALFDEASPSAAYAAQFTEPGFKSVEGERSPLVGTLLMREVVAFRFARAVGDVRLDPRVAEARRSLAHLGTESLLAVPLVVRDRFIGVIEIHQCDRTRKWHEGEIGLAESVAHQLATAVHQVRLHARLRRSARERDALFDAMSDAIYVFDRAGRLSRMNAAAERLEGQETVALVGTRCCDLFGAECPVGRVLETSARALFERQRGGAVVVDPLPNGAGAVATIRFL